MRKFLFLFIFLPLFTTLYAQDPDEIIIDSLLVNVDTSALTSGILYDRSSSLSRLDIFNDSINTATTSYFEQALHELRIASQNEKFADYKVLRQAYSPDSLMNVVDIGLINASYQKLNYVANDEPSGGLRMTNNVFEKIDNTEPVFKDKHLFLASPLKEYVMGNTIVFKFQNEFILQEATAKNLVSLSVDFGTDMEFIVYDNGSLVQTEIPIEYSETGYKTLTFTATFADGSSKTTEGMIHVKLPAPPPTDLVDTNYIWGSIPWRGFNESEAHVGKLKYRTFYHTNNGNTLKKLVKPIVIIDGFDPGDRRKIQDSDSPLPNEEHRSMEEMMVYPTSNGSVPLIPILRSLGYDVILVNQVDRWDNGYYIDGGADYIERNALTHVALYQRLNNLLVQNGSNEQLVIVGPSMGGQISRYALAYMEKEGLNHNTRLWVSIDSPHLGANIPVGVQTLVNLLNDIEDSVEANDFVENQLGSAAARQQLIEQYCGATNGVLNQNWLDGRTISQGYSQNKGRPIFINYYNNLFNNGLPGSDGYPQNLRKIAVVNGSLKYKKAFENPFEPLSYELAPAPYSDNLPGHGFQSLKIKGYTDVIGHSITLESYMMPNYGQSHKIAFYKKKGLLGWRYYDRFISNNNSRQNLDITPGGWFPAQRDMAKSILQSDPCEWWFFGWPGGGQICINNWEVNTLEHVGSFIPTVSALGIKNPDFNWNQPLNRNLVCTNEIPFDSYFGPKVNEQHTSFTQESVEWLLEELAGNPQPPTVYYEGENLMGPDAVCQNDLVTYEFDNCNPMPVLQWEVSGGLQIITSDDFSVTVENTTSSNVAGWIKAIFSNQVVQKDIWLGKPSIPAYLNGPEVVATGAVVTYSGGIAEGATSYQWWLPYPFDVINPFDTSSENWQVYPNAGRNTQVFTGTGGTNGHVQLMGENSCGVGDAQILYVEHGEGGSGQQQLPVYPYPNTADNAFNLDFSTYPSGSNYQIYIYDAYSNVIYEGSSENINKTISTLDIPTGNYFLHIHTDEEILQYQLIIQH